MKSYLLEHHFTHLFHISDVHILNGEERQQEFILQFKRTFQTIEQHPKFKKKTSLIVVTGDILDKGIKMSAIAIELLQILVDGLTKLAPTIIIPGNHDDKKDLGTSTLDSLTAVFNERMQTRSNLYYLKDTGIYLFGDNLALGHTSVIDKKLIRAQDINTTNRLKIALFHGMVDGSSSSTDTDFMLQNCDFLAKDFDGYDKVLLGDVHKAQAIGKDQRLWYAGSLIQKSFAEDRRQHGGLLVWDLASDPDTAPQYLHIPNDHEYLVLNVVKGQIAGEFTDSKGSLHLRNLKPFQVESLPKNTSLRFKCDQETLHSHLDALTKQLEQKTKIIKNNRIWTDHKTQTTPSHPTQQSDPFQEYLAKYYPDQIDELIDLHTKYHEENTHNLDETSCYGKWTLIHLSLENIYNYLGQHNLPFDQLPKDIISITGKNGAGKSKIIDSILLGIYGCGPKFVPHVITHGVKQGKTRITISVNGDTYQINRTFTRGKDNKNNKTTLSITKNDVDETATDKPENEKSIIRLFGERDDLCDTHISLQGHHQAFIHKKEREQRELLKRIFNTTVYETIEKTVKSDITETKSKFKKTQQELEAYPEVDLTQLTETLEGLQHLTPEIIGQRDQQIQLLRDNDIARERQNTLTQNQRTLSEELRQRQQTKINMTYSEPEIQTRLQQAQETISTLTTDLSQIQDSIDRCREQKHPISTTLLTDIKQLETRINQTQTSLSTCQNQQVDLASKNRKFTQQLSKETKILEKLTQEKYQLLSSLEPNRKWTYPNQSQYQQRLKQMGPVDSTDKQEQRQEQIQDLNTQIEKFQTQTKDLDLSKLEQQYTEYQDRQLQQKLVATTISGLQKQISGLEYQLENHQFSYDENCSCCRQNKTINLIPEKIAELELRQQQLKDNITISQDHQTYLDQHQQIPSIYQQFKEYGRQVADKTNLDRKRQDQLEIQKLEQEFTDFQQAQVKEQQLEQLTQKLKNQETKETQLQNELRLLQDQETHLTTQRQTYQLQLQSEQTEMKSFIQEKHHIQENTKLDQEINQLTQSLNTKQQTIQQQTQEIESLTQMKCDLQKNNEIDQQLGSLQQQLDQVTTELVKVVVSPPRLLEAELQNREQQLASHHRLIQETSQTQQQQRERQEIRCQLLNDRDIHQYDLDLYSKYLKITQDYPLYLNKKGIKTLETLINQYLWNMTRFKIEILDETTSLTFLKVDQGQKIPIDYCSGFEKFAISIAIRIALSKIHPFNSMNSLIIDEGFGVFDSNNLKRLPEMLEPLTLLFNQIFIITHIDDLQSELKQKIKISQTNGRPQIHY